MESDLIVKVKNLANHPGTILIDVREPAELQELGKIPTAVNIPLGVVSQDLSFDTRDESFISKYGRKKPEKDTPLIFYCRSGKRSAKAAEVAINLGYNKVKNYEGSWNDYATNEGLPK